MVHKISKLTQMAKSFEEGQKKGAILEKNTPIFIFGSNVKKLIYTSYDHDIVLKYQDNAKAASMMASTLVHEMVYDPKNPVDKIAPFLFSSEKSRKPTPVFQWFICFLDLTKVQHHIETSFTAKGKISILTFDKFCDLFLLRNVEDPITSMSRDDDRIIYENCRTRDCPLFCRSAPWTSYTEQIRNIPGRDFEDVVVGTKDEEVLQEYCTRFQIGFAMNPKDTQMFEVYGYLVNYSPRQIFRNTDLIDIFDKKLANTLSNTKIEPYRLQHIMPSSSANEMFIGQQKFWENHRLIPAITNQGNITGTILMLNLYMIYKENVMITDDTELIESQKKNIGEEYFDVIMQNAGQEVLLLRTLSTVKALVYLQSGRQYEVPLCILVDEEEQTLSKNMKPSPMFVYQMLQNTDNANPERDPYVQYKTPIMQVGYKHYALDGQPGALITMCTSRFNRDVVANQIFDRVTM